MENLSDKPEAAVSSPKPKAWAQVLKSPPPVHNNVSFDYFPLAEGSNIVSPPDEILKKGIDKFKFCIVGVFTKATLSFKSVDELAHKLWDDKGLILVSQKSATTFVFKFADLAKKYAVLSLGTCYFRNRPMVLKDWGGSVGEKVSSLPVWFKLSNVPDCYWTSEGLGSIASVIGRPICADARTSQLELLPFARMCVDYKVGDLLPDKIPVLTLDARGNKSVVDVAVEYAKKPLVCSGCKELGHLVSACPISTRIWVRKQGPLPKSGSMESSTPVVEDPNSAVACKSTAIIKEPNSDQPKPQEEEKWQEVPKKHSFSTKAQESSSEPSIIADVSPLSGSKHMLSPAASEGSPAPDNAFSSLLHVDELDANMCLKDGKLSKSQRKKQRKALEKALEKPPPPTSH